MSDVVIIEKKDLDFFEQAHKLLYEAHENNREKGFHVMTAELPAEKLIEGLGPDGRCFAAIEGDMLVGIMAVRFVQRDCWYAKGVIADQIYVATKPTHRGLHISSMLHKEIIKAARQRSVDKIEIRTAAENTAMQRACAKWGFHYVDFRAYKNLDHYTVVMCKWLGQKAPSSVFCGIQYGLRRLRTVFLYKPGRLRRFLA